MMKTLIVYYSFTGNNKALALELQQQLHCEIQQIKEWKKRSSLTILWDLLLKLKPKIHQPDLDLKQYKNIIFVAPIWDAKIASPMVSFIDHSKDNIKNYSFITICSGREGQKEKITQQLIRLIGKAPKTVTELKVNDLLPQEKKGKIRYTTPYRITKQDMEIFAVKLASFAESARVASLR